jgi:CheY-like chemotaxis protein
MDMQMPEMDGLEATQAIRRLEQELAGRAPATIIACTANALEADRTACFQAGMDGYVTKPVQVEELRRVLENRALTKASSEPAV